MDKDYLIRLIHEYNPQILGAPGSVPATRRDLYAEIEPWMGKKQAVAIVGLRRIGKTTLMRQLMAGLGGTPIFFSFDEEDAQKKEVLIFVLDYAIVTLHATSLFLDEIQYVEDWEGILKRYYDQKAIKIVVSGSESLEISRAKAALAGRLITFRLQPLSFREYLMLKGAGIDTGPAALEDYPAMEALYRQCITRTEFFEDAFIEYLWKGAFPELVQEEDSVVIRKYIHDLVVRKIIYRDIPAMFDIRRPDLLFELFRYACSTSSQMFDIQNLSRHFGVHAETVSNYLWYLRSAFLVRVAESYSASPAKRVRKNKKLYVVHPAIACAVLGYRREHIIEQVRGQFAETLFAGRYFWRDRYKHEVDAVLETAKGLVPVEIKFQGSISPTDTRNLRIFMDEYRAGTAILITRDRFDRKIVDGREFLFIPAWLALLAWTVSPEGPVTD
ncbi:ATP-binding protein [uncultured Methanoregula sp.]|uniref:ATP-binding protein n=1 Tax=uncultured Methanoregula sp. TaxID=1005933 RepID=UPI002AAC35B9|nr:ATP-binding protein [uncultured Methanoregula sp.]